MLANAEKFQAILLGSKYNFTPHINIRSYIKEADKNFKLLGDLIHPDANFSKHVNAICFKAGRQVNVLFCSVLMPKLTF